MPRGGSGHLAPDAVTNVVHGYAHLNADKDKEVLEVKSTSKKTKHADEDYAPFFHAVIHKDNKPLVENVVSRSERVDEEMFAKLSKKIFHHDDAEKKVEHEEEEKPKYKYGLRDLLNDSDLME